VDEFPSHFRLPAIDALPAAGPFATPGTEIYCPNSIPFTRTILSVILSAHNENIGDLGVLFFGNSLYVSDSLLFSSAQNIIPFTRACWPCFFTRFAYKMAQIFVIF
jgi:hypothetical protein